MKFKEKLIKILGGYTEEEFKEVTKAAKKWMRTTGGKTYSVITRKKLWGKVIEADGDLVIFPGVSFENCNLGINGDLNLLAGNVPFNGSNITVLGGKGQVRRAEDE